VTRDDAHATCKAQPGTAETYPFGPNTAVYKVGGKMFAVVPRSADPPTVSLKCDPEWSQVLRASYAAIGPGYHLNKKHWNTVVLDGTVPHDEVEELIRHSYELVVASLPRKLRGTVGS
jgi:predicted DNA-binding protein (MmcQ/YjbR family)